MKKIMLIAAVILTIATANAYQWNTWPPLKVVNNTNVAYSIYLQPDNEWLTVQPGTSAYATTRGNGALYLSWGGNTVYHVTQNYSFNDAVKRGTMSAESATLDSTMILDTTWWLTNLGDNSILVLDGNTSDGKNMQLTATRVTGVGVWRGADNINALGDVFCLDSGVVGFVNQNDGFRCPPYETQVVLANSDYIENISWVDPDYLIQEVYYGCWGIGSCRANSAASTPGYYVYGIDTVPYSVQNTENALFLKIPPNV